MQLLKNLSIAAFMSAACSAQAAVVWDETAQGDLSNNGLAPSALVFAAGSNQVLGDTGNNGQVVDRDYFHFTVPAGMRLTAITVLGNTNVSGGSSFFGLQVGDQLTVAPSGAGADAMLGYTHYGNDFIGLDLLPLLAVAYPLGLPSATYSIWVQETGGPATYGFDFVVAEVPLPGAGTLLGAGLVSLAGLRRRRNAR